MASGGSPVGAPHAGGAVAAAGAPTEFLDLTNGQGGPSAGAGAAMMSDPYLNEGTFAAYADEGEFDEAEEGGDHEEQDEEDDEEFDDADDGGGHYRSGSGGSSLLGDHSEGMGFASSGATPAASAAAASAAPSGTASTSRMRVVVDPSTPGKVVETGKEHTGRWTREEHEAFLSALKMYGKEWKKVAAKVKTRTVVQTRTHAQKYFQKLQKSTGGDGASPGGVDDDYDGAGGGGMGSVGTSSRKKNRRSSSATISAAQVISGLSSARSNSMLPPHPAAPTSASTSLAGPVSHSTSISFVTAGSSHSGVGQPLGPPPPPLQPSHPAARHGFSSSSYMKITAPDPTLALKSPAGFPEPSPAATGKRKLAEIAAARMLAGVAGSTQLPHQKPYATTSGAGGGRSSLGTSGGIDDDEGPPTPPPSSASSSGALAGGVLLSLREGPPPPPPLALDGGRSTNSALPRPGLSLQIVNPDSLGVSYGSRSRTGSSPVTPWDGQLEELVSRQTADGGERSTELNAGASAEATAPAQSLSQPPSHVHAAAGPSQGYSRSPLHVAVCESNIDAVRQVIDEQRSALSHDDFLKYLRKTDDLGYAPLHTACALRLTMELATNEQQDDGTITALELVSLLLQAGADVMQRDRSDNTPLHWAARAGDSAVAEKLLLSADLDARNRDGETPLHWALRAGRRARVVTATLLQNGARPDLLNKAFKRPIDVAVEGFLDEPNSYASVRASVDAGKKLKKDLIRVRKETKANRRETRANLLVRSPHSRTLVLHHPECLEHHPKSSTDWETPDRVVSIMRRVLPQSDATGDTETSGIFPHEVTVSQDFERAKLDLLRRVHSTEYLSFVNQLSKDLEKQLKENGSQVDDDASFTSPPPVVPFTPLVQRTMIKIDDASVKCGLSSDTSFSAGSLRAARRAAGSVQHAIDCVLVGRNRNAFCVVRPPGHHAGISGLLEGGESCGFCIFNNVAAGALYAISDDRRVCQRVAICDLDVHHGNGTEEIVRRCRDPSKLFFFSIHLFDKDKRRRNGNQYYYKFYPGTGDEDDLALNIINVPIVPLWKDASSIPATSTRSHNTRQKARSSQDAQEESSETETPRDGSRASDGGSDGGSTSAASPRHPSSSTSGTSGRAAYRQAIQSRLLPALRAFNPDLILISAGFDAAKGDVGNARHERGRERMGLDLDPEDYAWTTRKILEIADICCHGRVVSVLEGGYGRTPAAPQVIEGQGNALDRTVFSECAIRHLQALIDPYDLESRFSS